MKDIAVTYWGGNGFLVSLGSTGLLFDVSEHGSGPHLQPDSELLNRFDSLFVFFSHHHENHFSSSVYDLCPEHTVFILGHDIPLPYRGIRMHPGDEQHLAGLSVKAFASTEEGVSYLVDFAGITIFHAGDLNLWHWRDQSTVSQIQEAEKAFYACVSLLPVSKIDLAFFPVDPRQGSMYDAGAGYFIMTVKPRILIPMHFQDRADIAVRFASTSETANTQIVPLPLPGDRVDLQLSETEGSAPDQKLHELLNDPTFGA